MAHCNLWSQDCPRYASSYEAGRGAKLDRKFYGYASLAVALAGAIFAGLQYWQARVPTPQPKAQTQVSNQTNTGCAAIGTSGGSVNLNCSRNVNISTGTHEKPFKRIEMTVDGSSIKDFSQTIDAQDDKIVYLKLLVDPEAQNDLFKLYDHNNGTAEGELNVTYVAPCPEGQPGDCGGTEYVISTKEGGMLYWENGSWRLDGYFSIEPVQGLHQGYTSTGIVGIPDSQARLADPSAR